MAGSFIWSVTYTDIHSGWTATRAVWNRGAHGVVEVTREIEAELPFALLGFDCDNGGEFLNHHLLRYFAERPRPVSFTRSRPTTRTTTAMWSKRTGPTCANCSATTDWRTPR